MTISIKGYLTLVGECYTNCLLIPRHRGWCELV